MLDASALKRYILDFHDRDLRGLRPRELKVDSIKGKATIIMGPRRSGKTHYLFTLMKGKRERYLYLDLEHPIFYSLEPSDFPKILDSYKELYPELSPVIMLDEVQAVPEWERMVRYAIDLGFETYVTGSSSKLLASEIASHLRGRSLSYTLLPLSFREYLTFRGIDFRGREIYRNYHRIVAALNDFLKYGAYPEVALVDSENIRMRILREYLDLVIRKDVLERFRLRNRKLLNDLTLFALNSYSKYVSYDSLYRLHKGRTRVTKRTITNYITYLSEAFFLFTLSRYSPSIKERIVAPRKIYLIDTGYGNFGAKSVSRDMENAVFLELYRRYVNDLTAELYYWKGGSGHEVDFVVVKEGRVRELIQVAYSLEEERAVSREVRSLLKAKELLNCGDLKIITWNDEWERKFSWWGESGVVRAIPLWKWLLTPS